MKPIIADFTYKSYNNIDIESQKPEDNRFKAL